VLMDRHAAERVAPLDHRGIVVRVRDRDAGDAAKGAHDLDGGVVDEADAVPQDVAVRRADQQGALGDRERRRGADADQDRIMLRPHEVDEIARRFAETVKARDYVFNRYAP